MYSEIVNTHNWTKKQQLPCGRAVWDIMLLRIRGNFSAGKRIHMIKEKHSEFILNFTTELLFAKGSVIFTLYNFPY